MKTEGFNLIFGWIGPFYSGRSQKLFFQGKELSFDFIFQLGWQGIFGSLYGLVGGIGLFSGM
jgi:hypothetical protein